MTPEFKICSHCGNMVGVIRNAGVPIMCCGQKMDTLVPNTTEASGEKHLPAVKVDGDVVTVNVGSVTHPMTEEHYIGWVYLHTENGGQRKALKAGQEPEVKFALADDKAIAAYAWCNLHGLWKTEI
ncbi:MAG: desulfoferrodoxin [Oscillospiraceae bacterium]|nr:desulfoferrodoxin [Oscillospiraceae bacterium]